MEFNRGTEDKGINDTDKESVPEDPMGLINNHTVQLEDVLNAVGNRLELDLAKLEEHNQRLLRELEGNSIHIAMIRGRLLALDEFRGVTNNAVSDFKANVKQSDMQCDPNFNEEKAKGMFPSPYATNSMHSDGGVHYGKALS